MTRTRATDEPSGLRRSARRFGCVLGLAAILSQTFVLLFHHPAGAMTMAGPALVAGHHHAQADPRSPASGGKAPASMPPHCPICLALHVLGGFVPPTAAALPAEAPRVEAAFSRAPAPSVVGGLVLGGAQPRAPPPLP
jgi:DUF2946 family protein